MKIDQFPDTDHVANVCLLRCGAAECRYLSFVGGSLATGYQYSCEKKSTLKNACDRNAGQRGYGLGDNCDGLDWR
jgi:hypothetical protein